MNLFINNQDKSAIIALNNGEDSKIMVSITLNIKLINNSINRYKLTWDIWINSYHIRDKIRINILLNKRMTPSSMKLIKANLIKRKTKVKKMPIIKINITKNMLQSKEKKELWIISLWRVFKSTLSGNIFKIKLK